MDQIKEDIGLGEEREARDSEGNIIKLKEKSCLDPEIKELKDKMFIQFDPSNSPEQKLAAMTYIIEKMISDRDQ